MKIAVCVDNEAEGERIRLLLEQLGRELCVPLEVDRLASGAALLEQRPGQYGLLLLDGDMDDCVAVGRWLRGTQRECQCILLSRDNRSALLGYAIHPDGFVRKPVGYRALRSAMLLCRRSWREELRTLSVTANRVQVPVAWADIYYMEIRGRVLDIHGRYGQIETHLSMTRAEEQLRDAPFLKCHRSYLVNLFQVRSLGAEGAAMADGALVPVSEDRLEGALARWRRFQEENPVFFRERGEEAGDW